MAASTTFSATTIIFGDQLEAKIRRRAVAASFEYRVLDDLTLTLGGGASLGGGLDLRGLRYDFGPGPVGTLGAGYRLLDGDGWEPFLLLGGAFSGSTVPTTRMSDGARERLSALDLRFSVTAGETFLDTLVPYVTLRGFGGPVLWRVGQFDLNGTDKYHFQLGAGLLVTSGIIDAFFEIVPLGERAAVFGGAVAF
ncbi:MAG: hypothetical protein KC731_03470 [Myxococcales bacterium]|nr:hypothetical protein [Myxococcales bacterium]